MQKYLQALSNWKNFGTTQACASWSFRLNTESFSVHLTLRVHKRLLLTEKFLDEESKNLRLKSKATPEFYSQLQYKQTGNIRKSFKFNCFKAANPQNSHVHDIVQSWFKSNLFVLHCTKETKEVSNYTPKCKNKEKKLHLQLCFSI